MKTLRESGVSAAAILRYLKRFDEIGGENHGMIVIKDGEKVFEKYCYPYQNYFFFITFVRNYKFHEQLHPQNITLPPLLIYNNTINGTGKCAFHLKINWQLPKIRGTGGMAGNHWRHRLA